MRARLVRRLAGLGLLLLAAATGGCTTMPVTSMLQLARVDLASTDPASLRAAVKLPRALRLRPHGNVLRIAVKLRGGDEEAQNFALQDVAEPGDATLQADSDAGSQTVAFRIDPADVTKLTAFRDRLKSKQQAAGTSGGAITIAVQPQACRAGEIADGAIPITTYLRTRETGSYVPLARNLDLRSLYPSANVSTLIPPCE